MFSIVNPSRPSPLNIILLTPFSFLSLFCYPHFIFSVFVVGESACATAAPQPPHPTPPPHPGGPSGPLPSPSAQSAQSMHTISNMCTMLYFRFDICLFKTFAYVFLFVSFSCISLFVFVFGCYVARSIVVFMCVFLSCPCCRSSLFVSSQSCVCVFPLLSLYIYIYMCFVFILFTRCFVFLFLCLYCHGSFYYLSVF